MASCLQGNVLKFYLHVSNDSKRINSAELHCRKQCISNQSLHLKIAVPKRVSLNVITEKSKMKTSKIFAK